MRNGVCDECGSTDVRYARNGLFVRGAGAGMNVGRGFLKNLGDTYDLVCPRCGYFARFFEIGSEALRKIEAEWEKVPVRDRLPASGEE